MADYSVSVQGNDEKELARFNFERCHLPIFHNKSRALAGCCAGMTLKTSHSSKGKTPPTRESQRCVPSFLKTLRVPTMEDLSASEETREYLNAHQLQHGYHARGVRDDDRKDLARDNEDVDEGRKPHGAYKPDMSMASSAYCRACKKQHRSKSGFGEGKAPQALEGLKFKNKEGQQRAERGRGKGAKGGAREAPSAPQGADDGKASMKSASADDCDCECHGHDVRDPEPELDTTAVSPHICSYLAMGWEDDDTLRYIGANDLRYAPRRSDRRTRMKEHGRTRRELRQSVMLH